MNYFYTPPELIGKELLTIRGDEFAHLTHVMRKRVGDEFHVVDGRGRMYRVTLMKISGRNAECSILGHTVNRNEPPHHCVLAVGILKNSARFDFLVEKTTEVGVSEIIPLTTERTIARQAKTERWKKIALAAMKQSGRSVLPGIGELTSLNSLVRSFNRDAIRLIAHEGSLSTLDGARTTIHSGMTVVICIGPEGGFTEEELRFAEGSGFEIVGLGPRRLRTETAAIVAASMLGLR